MKTNNRIDLLPPSVQFAKARRRQIKILAVAQTAVFLVLAGIAFTLVALEQRARETSRGLSQQLAALDPSPAEIAEKLQSTRAEAAYTDEFLDAAFDADALYFISNATPEGAALSRMDFTGSEFILAGTAADILSIEIHATNLSEFFEVSLGRISRENGVYAYEIRLFGGPE